MAICIFVGNLPYESTEADLTDYFSRVKASKITLATKFDGRSSGYALVEFEDKEDADTFITRYNGSSFSGRRLEVRLDRKASSSSFRPVEKGKAAASVFVSNIPYSVMKGLDMAGYFAEKVEGVLEGYIYYSKAGKFRPRSKGCGVVRFDTVEHAKECVEKMNETEWLGRTIYCQLDKELR
ncbi:hypothetical protein ADUPG1_012785 [Aduncisulcus paluster]|uniref:RRM domain-containing protein n=1 Tax=Aduncisulcus paluster TaxID=2918883 RepID=A0ABQ5K2H3_9EUKA|nr:hypothetical protein ADUPG1_012785 [Aduncisulcus paluster]